MKRHIRCLIKNYRICKPPSMRIMNDQKMKPPSKRVVVLGAGASCSYSDSPTKLRPPLANELISTYFKLDISVNPYVRVGDIINYVRETRGIGPNEFATWKEDIERFLTEIDEKIRTIASRLTNKRPPDNALKEFHLLQRSYNQLIFLFASIFNEIQNGPVSVPYALLSDELAETDTCITFNWDTLLDKALASTSKWSPATGYSIRPESIFDDGWQKPEDYGPLNGGPQYLKLHGSTNWLTPYSFSDLSTGKRRTISGYAIDELFVFHRASRPYQTYENRYWGPYEPYSYCYYPPNLPCHRDDTQPGYTSVTVIVAPDLNKDTKVVIGDEAVYSMPLIVPPVKNKQHLIYGTVFSSLWEKARIALSECEELIVIGYSFPATDVLSKRLFRKALKYNTGIKRVVIWNPNPDSIINIFINNFGIRRERLQIKSCKFEPQRYPQLRVL